jgi:heme exporter protein A
VSTLLRFENVSLRRGGQLLFEGLDLALAAGEALQVAGPNGSGKSSLIRLAAGLLRPECGSVEATTSSLADDSLALDRELSLQAALSFWGGDVGKGLEALGLAALRHVPVRLLSSGQRKRATLARVSASAAPLWLLDDPLNGLDSAGADLLGTLLQSHRAGGGAILAASHVELPGIWQTLELGR